MGVNIVYLFDCDDYILHLYYLIDVDLLSYSYSKCLYVISFVILLLLSLLLMVLLLSLLLMVFLFLFNNSYFFMLIWLDVNVLTNWFTFDLIYLMHLFILLYYFYLLYFYSYYLCFYCYYYGFAIIISLFGWYSIKVTFLTLYFYLLIFSLLVKDYFMNSLLLLS